jgi:hypothetical protein
VYAAGFDNNMFGVRDGQTVCDTTGYGNKAISFGPNSFSRVGVVTTFTEINFVGDCSWVQDENGNIMHRPTFKQYPFFEAPSSTVPVLAGRVTGDTEPSVLIKPNGIEFGAGGSSPTDITFVRAAANVGGMASGDSFHLDGTWNGGHLILGTQHIWADSTGDIRIKDGAPTSDTDGVVLGTQS